MIENVPLLRAAGDADDVLINDRVTDLRIDKIAVSYGPLPEHFAYLFRYERRWYHGNNACLEQPLDTIGDVRRHLTAPSDCPEARTPANVAAQLRDRCGAERVHGAHGREPRRARGRGRRRPDS